MSGSRNGKKRRYKEANETYKRLTLEQIKENVIQALDNPFTDHISKDETRISYTGEFYVQMKKYIDEGMTDVEAYTACGYDPDKLGTARAHKAAVQAKDFEKSQKKYDWRSYSGSEMPDTVNVDDYRVLAAQLEARARVLETINEVQKKILPELQDSITVLKQNSQK